jgi:hypothetical protein
MSDEWGPWIDHDGNGYPVQAGTLVQAINRVGSIYSARVMHQNPSFNAWDWSSCPNWPSFHVMRYRTRNPRGLIILQEIAADPQPVLEDA